MAALATDRCLPPRGFWRALERRGIAPAAVLRRAGLPASLHQNETGYVTTAQLFAIWKAVEAVARDPGLGIALAEAPDPDRPKPALVAAFYAATYRDALSLLADTKRYGGCFQLRFEEQDGRFAIAKDWLFATEAEPALSADAGFASLLELGRKGTGHHLIPVRMDFRHADPKSEAHHAFFRCPIHYGTPRNLLVLRAADVDLPFPGHNAELLGILAPALKRSPGVFDAVPLGERVKDALKRNLADGRPAVAAVANALAMSERTLQRRITEAGTTFRALLLETRQELGRHLLADPSMGIERAAGLLGYRNTSAFHRAFRAWEGVTPSEWKLRNGTD